jgi:hypothetical protein
MQRLDASAIEGMAVELPQRIERSIYETREEFDQRISEVIRSIRDQQAAIDRRVDTLPHVQWIRPTYFEWVALHQIRRMTHEEIGKQYHVAVAGKHYRADGNRKRRTAARRFLAAGDANLRSACWPS